MEILSSVYQSNADKQWRRLGQTCDSLFSCLIVREQRSVADGFGVNPPGCPEREGDLVHGMVTQWWSWYDRNSPWDWLLCNIEAKILLFWVADPHWSSFLTFENGHKYFLTSLSILIIFVILFLCFSIQLLCWRIHTCHHILKCTLSLHFPIFSYSARVLSMSRYLNLKRSVSTQSTNNWEVNCIISQLMLCSDVWGGEEEATCQHWNLLNSHNISKRINALSI